jgi:tetratricopeptide (TPR) repeat protein
MRLDFHPPVDAQLAVRVIVPAILPDDQRAWVQETLTADAPPARVKVITDETIATIAGWPLRIVVAQLEAAEGRVLEWRLAGFFAFFEHAAAVLARATEGARFTAMVPELRAALRAATPVWTDEVVALHELWDVTATRAPRASAPAIVVPAAPVIAPPVAPASAETIAAWEAAAAADPTEVDALYDAGQAYYLRREFAAALDCWTRARARAPGDFGVAKKRVQALRALARHADADAAMIEVRALWQASTDPAVRLVDEVVIDQFEVAGATVHALETLRPRDPRAYPVLAFRVVDRAPLTIVRVETSEYARDRGVPYVLSVAHGRAYKVVGTSAALPPYPELKATATTLIGDALATPAS